MELKDFATIEKGWCEGIGGPYPQEHVEWYLKVFAFVKRQIPNISAHPFPDGDHVVLLANLTFYDVTIKTYFSERKAEMFVHRNDIPINDDNWVEKEFNLSEDSAWEKLELYLKGVCLLSSDCRQGSTD